MHLPASHHEGRGSSPRWQAFIFIDADVNKIDSHRCRSKRANQQWQQSHPAVHGFVTCAFVHVWSMTDTCLKLDPATLFYEHTRSASDQFAPRFWDDFDKL